MNPDSTSRISSICDGSKAMVTSLEDSHDPQPRGVHTHAEDVSIVTWDKEGDTKDPFNWSFKKKAWTVGLGLLISFAASTNGTIISVAHAAINDEFNISDTNFPNSYWPIVSWGVGGALFPLLLFPVMEDFGVRPVLLSTYFIFICTLIPVGLALNFATLIIARFFSGGCVQLLANAVAGIISNVFDDDRARSIPINLYVTTYLSATSAGPVVGAVILQQLSWRWIGHIETIWTAALFPLIIVGMPESRGSAILKSRARMQRRRGHKAYTLDELEHKSFRKVMIKSVTRPLFMLVTEPVVFVATLWAAFSLGTIYLFTQSTEQVFASLYGFSAIGAGYVQGAIVIGEILGCALAVFSNKWYFDSAARNTETPGLPIPEARLYASTIGGFFGVAGGMMVYGWTAYEHIPWIAPTIGLGMVGFGTTAVVVSVANYLVDAYSKYAASALAAVGLVENSTIAFLPLAATSMYSNLGFHWASTLLACISLLLVAAPFAVYRWGTQIRQSSPFMKEAVIDRQQDSNAVPAEV